MAIGISLYELAEETDADADAVLALIQPSGLLRRPNSSCRLRPTCG
jgi:hypothetical protein